jgi:hypothetical protein
MTTISSGQTVVTPQLAGQVSLTAATEGVALADSTTVAAFTDTNTSDTASSFMATIDWGDGTTTSGTVAGSSGAFTVTGGHTYADEGNFALGVTITETANSTTLPLSGTVTAAEADVLTGHANIFAITDGQPRTGTLVTFTDSDTSNVASDFSAKVTLQAGAYLRGPVVITDTAGRISVSGTFFYSGSWGNLRTGGWVTLTDGAPGTTTAHAPFEVNVAPPAGKAVVNTGLSSLASQSGVRSASDLVWQNHANGGNGLFAAGSNSVLQASHDFAGSAIIPPATDILFHNTTAHASHVTSTSLASFATLDAGGLDRGHGTDALLFRDGRVGELGSWAASNGLNTGSHITDGSSTDYRTVR